MNFPVPTIRVNEFNRIMNAFDRVSATYLREEDDLPFRCATGFANFVRSKIFSGQLPSQNPSYNERYLAWKKAYGDFQRPWMLMGDLALAITIFRNEGGGWHGGIPGDVLDSGGKSWFGQGDRGPSKPIAMYARTLESGLPPQKKRPVFEPATEEFRQTEMPKQINRSKQLIREQWR
jgi:hypothetical protein